MVQAMPHRRILSILTYHSLDDSGSVLSTAPQVFAEQMKILSELDVEVISLEDAPGALLNAAAGARLVAITFDDGFRNIFEAGFPVLQRYGFSATVFLVSDYCGRDNSWPSQPAFIQRRPLLGWTEVKEMSAAGIVFGGHTRTHPDLRSVTSAVAGEEIVSSKKAIEDAVGRSVRSFAYPYGAYNEEVKRLAKMHFSLACTTQLDFAGAESDLFALERLDTYYLRRPALFRRLFSVELNLYIRLRRTIRDLRSGHGM
jgi:peptidoglycan/xylan/chitin deacetylase (PgdA/CDA1 family)